MKTGNEKTHNFLSLSLSLSPLFIPMPELVYPELLARF